MDKETLKESFRAIINNDTDFADAAKFVFIEESQGTETELGYFIRLCHIQSNFDDTFDFIFDQLSQPPEHRSDFLHLIQCLEHLTHCCASRNTLH